MRFTFFFLIAFLCSWNSAKAQEIPSEIQGNWASPDCGRYSEGLILSRHFYLKSTKKDMTLLPAQKDGKRADYLILSLGGDKRPIRLEDDGILKIGIYGDKKDAKNWDDLQLDSRMEYTACPEAPSIVPKLMARLMSAFFDKSLYQQNQRTTPTMHLGDKFEKHTLSIMTQP